MKANEKKLVITSALPYANGPIHLGHMVEYIQTDIFARFKRLTGAKLIYVCADDTHGTPIDIKAKQEGILPELLIDRIHREHIQDFSDFSISFDYYSSTNSKENKEYADFFFLTLKNKGLIYQKETEQMYCNNCRMFLPDRYVKGRCPKCKADDQYGDVCEKCHATYSTTDLKEPFCSICGTTPVKKTSLHYFFKLSTCEKQVKEWLDKNKNLQPEVRNYVNSWIKEGVKDWCISRDGPYFGFKIPGEENKFYYVWLDAPIAYIASTAKYCKENNENVDDYWKKGRIIHFIGKDISYFHFLFWPAMLMNTGYSLPEDIKVHGFMTINKEKMSKSRGTFITAKDYLKVLDPSYLRFYYASNLSNNINDIDLDFEDFKSKINNSLVAGLGNFVYRTLSFLNKNFDSTLGKLIKTKETKEVAAYFEKIKKAYEECNFREAVKLIMEVSAIGNKYMQESEPWKLIKEDREKALEVLTVCANIAKNLSILIKPILPSVAEKIEKQLNLKYLTWADLGFDLENKKISQAELLVKKIEDEIKLIQTKDPFSKLDLKVARVLEAKQHPDADKLLVLQVDLGEKRQLVAGLAKHYSPKDLVGKNIVMVANLKHAKLRGEISAGMLLAATDKDNNVKILEAPKSMPGDDVFVDSVKKEPAKEIDIADVHSLPIIANEGKITYKGMVLKTKKEDISPKLKGTGRVS